MLENTKTVQTHKIQTERRKRNSQSIKLKLLLLLLLICESPSERDDRMINATNMISCQFRTHIYTFSFAFSVVHCCCCGWCCWLDGWSFFTCLLLALLLLSSLFLHCCHLLLLAVFVNTFVWSPLFIWTFFISHFIYYCYYYYTYFVWFCFFVVSVCCDCCCLVRLHLFVCMCYVYNLSFFSFLLFQNYLQPHTHNEMERGKMTFTSCKCIIIRCACSMFIQ